MVNNIVKTDSADITSKNPWPYNPDHYTHPSDRAALKALKAIPGFHQVMKTFLKLWDERIYRIKNMASRVRINEYQLREYYDLLPPICEKLGIDIPELYLELSPVANAFTFGDTKPFIIVTSALFETIPEHLIPSVLAHECGHIACHHTLYTTISTFLLDKAFGALYRFTPFANLTTIPLEMAFYYWMRCSEYSADRAAVLCDETSENTFEVCMRLAGFDKDIKGQFNKREFLLQGKEYRDMIADNKWDSILETIVMMNMSHPLSSVRALEAVEFEKSEQFDRILSGTYKQNQEPEEEEQSEEKAEKKSKKKIEFPKFPKKKESGEVSEEPVGSIPDEIRKYKELFDEGVLTEEEFTAKKRQLLEM